MSHGPVEKLLPRSGGSVYRLIRMAAGRALEISEGKPSLINNPSTDKATTIALEEILQGKIEAKPAKDTFSFAEKPESE